MLQYQERPTTGREHEWPQKVDARDQQRQADRGACPTPPRPCPPTLSSILRTRSSSRTACSPRCSPVFIQGLDPRSTATNIPDATRPVLLLPDFCQKGPRPHSLFCPTNGATPIGPLGGMLGMLLTCGCCCTCVRTASASWIQPWQKPDPCCQCHSPAFSSRFVSRRAKLTDPRWPVASQHVRHDSGSPSSHLSASTRSCVRTRRRSLPICASTGGPPAGMPPADMPGRWHNSLQSHVSTALQQGKRTLALAPRTLRAATFR